MPCRDNWGGETYQDIEARKRADETAQAMCELMHWLETKDMLLMLPARAQFWWANHKEEDRKRVAREHEQRQENESRESALAKLSPYERELLGIKK